jgi:ABC-type sugar transport system substrate-binding protein
MKKILCILSMLLVVVMVWGVEIGFVAANLSAVTQARVAEKLESISKTNGWTMYTSNSAGSWENMNNLVENYVSKKVDLIVIAMGQANSLQSSLKAAKAAGIPVIGIDSEYSELLTADILTNNWEMGAKVATYLVDRLDHKGNIIVFKFDQFYGTRYRGKALDVVLTEEPNIKVLEVHHLPPAGFVEDAQKTMESYLLKYGDKIDAVWCAWDDPAYGVSLAIKAAGYSQKDMFVVGIDGNERNLNMIFANNTPVVATIIQPFELSAVKVSELIQKIVVEKKSPESVIGAVRVIYMDTPLVTSANAAEYLK